MKTDTPRTEDQFKIWIDGEQMCYADFARELERENARLRAFAEAVRDIALRPIDASDAMDDIDTLVGDYFALPNAMMSREDRRTEPRQHDQ